MMQADSTHMRSALQCVEAVAGVERPVAVEALVSGACARLVARVPQMAPGAAEALLCEVVGAGALSDEALAPAAHALIERAPSVPAVVIEAAAVGGAVLLASLPVGAKRRIIEAAPERFIHQLFPLLMEYIAPTRHTRVLSDVLGLSRQLPAERRSAIAPLSALLSLVGSSARTARLPRLSPPLARSRLPPPRRPSTRSSSSCRTTSTRTLSTSSSRCCAATC